MPKQVFIFLLSLTLFILPLIASQSVAQKPSSSPKALGGKSSLNTQIFEAESSVETFQDQVKLVRDMAGESQVIFKNRTGFFILEDSSSGAQFKNRLLNAAKANRGVSVSFDKETRVIKDVSEKE